MKIGDSYKHNKLSLGWVSKLKAPMSTSPWLIDIEYNDKEPLGSGGIIGRRCWPLSSISRKPY